jgi:hypothetical protein
LNLVATWAVSPLLSWYEGPLTVVESGRSMYGYSPPIMLAQSSPKYAIAKAFGEPSIYTYAPIRSMYYFVSSASKHWQSRKEPQLDACISLSIPTLISNVSSFSTAT